jgi:hypothetical protein
VRTASYRSAKSAADGGGRAAANGSAARGTGSQMQKSRHHVLTAVSKPVTGFATGLAARRIPTLQRNLLSSCLQTQYVYQPTRCRNPEDQISGQVLRFGTKRSVR